MYNNEKETQYHILGKMNPAEEFYFVTNLIKKYEREQAEKKKTEITEFDVGKIRKSKKVRQCEEDLTFKVQVRIAVDQHCNVEKWDKVGIPESMVKANNQALQQGEEIKNVFETKFGKLIVKTDAVFNDKGDRLYTNIMFDGEIEENCSIVW